MEYFTVTQEQALRLGDAFIPAGPDGEGVLLFGVPDVVIHPETRQSLAVLFKSWGVCPKCSRSVPYLELASETTNIVFACQKDGFLWCKSREPKGEQS